MLRSKLAVALPLMAIFAVPALAPLSASADNWRQTSHNQQTDKNNWRNAAIGAGAVAVYGLLTHNTTIAAIGAAGAAYSANRYEEDRHSQSQQQNDYGYYHRDRRNGNDGWDSNRDHNYSSNRGRDYGHDSNRGHDRF